MNNVSPDNKTQTAFVAMHVQSLHCQSFESCTSEYLQQHAALIISSTGSSTLQLEAGASLRRKYMWPHAEDDCFGRIKGPEIKAKPK